MLLLRKQNFSVGTVKKGHDSPSASKETFYENFKICLALEGSAVWEIEDSTHDIVPGDIIFLNYGQKRHFTAFGEAGFKLCVFSFKRDAFSALHHFVFFLECVKNRGNVIKSSASARILHEIYLSMQEDHPLRYELASAKFTEFFIKLEKEAGYAPSLYPNADREMLDILDYIDANITSDISLQKVAARTGLTESSFSRRFSKLNGISYKKYVTAKRISRAIMLLQTTDMKMSDIAWECGFDSVSGFYDAFKKQTGVTPSRFADVGV